MKDNVNVVYHVTDLDVLNFTDEVKRKLANRSTFHSTFRYGSAGAQATLGALAGAAKVIGWGVSTASGLGLGATYIFGLGQIFDTKSHAQAYEQAFTAIQAAEATYYFHQLGMGFQKEKVNGHSVLDSTLGHARDDVPSATHLTPDGESLYYRASKILKVLEDTLAAKIPDLQDLKEAQGESSGASPAKSTDAAPDTSETPLPRRFEATTVTPEAKALNDSDQEAERAREEAQKPLVDAMRAAKKELAKTGRTIDYGAVLRAGGYDVKYGTTRAGYFQFLKEEPVVADKITLMAEEANRQRSAP